MVEAARSGSSGDHEETQIEHGISGWPGFKVSEPLILGSQPLASLVAFERTARMRSAAHAVARPPVPR